MDKTALFEAQVALTDGPMMNLPLLNVALGRSFMQPPFDGSGSSAMSINSVYTKFLTAYEQLLLSNEYIENSQSFGKLQTKY